MSDFDDRLHHVFQSAADQIPIAPSPLSGVMARGQTRQRRQRTISVVVAIVVVAATVTVSLSLRAGGSHGTSIASHGALPGASATLQWKAVNTAASLGFESNLTSGGTTALYAISTAPGVAATNTNANPPVVLYRSTDGVNWSTVAGPANLSLADLSATGSRVYAVGTGAATAAVGHGPPAAFEIASSSDGSSWQRAGLNLDLAAIFSKGTGNGTEAARVTSGPAGVLAAVTVNANVDLAKVLPAGAPAPSSWAATASGVDLLKGACPAPTPDVGAAAKRAGLSASTATSPPATVAAGDPALCYDPSGPGYHSLVSDQSLGPVLASYTWAQLGISGDTERAVLDEPFGFLSTDGSTFHRVDLPASPGSSEPDITAGPSGFALVGADRVTTNYNQQYSLWQSSNGADWTKAAALPTPVDYVQELGVLGGHYAIVNGGTSAELDTLVGNTWNATRLDQVTTSAKVATTTHTSLLLSSFGPLGFAGILETPVETPGATGPNGTLPPQNPSLSDTVIFSPDGVTWSSRTLSDVAGTQIGEPYSVQVTTTQVVVVAPKGPASGPDVLRPSIALVGTATTSG